MNKDEVSSGWLKETRKGYLRIVALTLLSRKPHHGYEIMKEIKVRTGGFWRPTPGGIYPILQSLEESAYIQGEWDSGLRKRKTYTITEAGRSVLQQALTRQNQIAGTMRDLFKEYMKDVLNIKSDTAPPIPNPFSTFLDEDQRNNDSISILQKKRIQIQDHIEGLRKELENIDKRLATKKKHSKTSSDRRSK
jgi:DNA-binding PadR family transcriptional regulator